MTNITTDDLLIKYKEYLKNNVPSLVKGSVGYYGTLLKRVPFDYFDIVFDKWSVTGSKSNHFKEKIIVNKKTYYTKSCDKRRYDLYNFYKNNIKKHYIDKNTSYNYLELIVSFINHNDIVYALSIADIVTGLSELAYRYFLDYKKECKKQKALEKIELPIKEGEVKSKPKYFRDCRYALRLLRDWLQLDKDFIQNVEHKAELVDVRETIVKSLIYNIDGAKALVREIGVDNFIKYAIEQSYFFEPVIVNEQMGDIVESFVSNKELYARKSTKTKDDEKNDNDIDNIITIKDTYSQKIDYERTAKSAASEATITEKKDDAIKAAKKSIWAASQLQNSTDEITNAITNAINRVVKDFGTYKEEDLKNEANKMKNVKSKFYFFGDTVANIINYPIIIDNDGNAQVRMLINDKTGYTISAGKGSIFQNYKISHIWGKAYDPRYFTNLWNIVLVPAWANDLLDKQNPYKGSLESRLQSTIMRICEVLYFGKGEKQIGDCRWEELNMPKPSIINDRKDIVKPKESVSINVPKDRIIGEESKDGSPYLINVITKKKVIKKDDEKKKKQIEKEIVGDIVKYKVYI